MRKAVAAFIILAGIHALAGKAQAAAYPYVQDRGAVEVGTTTCIAIATTPALALSTGTNVLEEDVSGPTLFGGTTMPTQTRGEFMQKRIQIEFFNDTAVDAYIGYNAQVSTMPGTNYGRRVPAGSSWNHDCSVKEHWIVGGATSTQKFVITQER